MALSQELSGLVLSRLYWVVYTWRINNTKVFQTLVFESYGQALDN